MYTELKEKEVKTRKPHQCEWCNEPISKGITAHYRAYIWENGFQHGWMHPECWDAMGECDSSELAEGWAPGDYQRGSAEYIA